MKVGTVPGPVQNAASFEFWVRPHVQVMRRLIIARAGQADADDILQDALTRAWLKRDTYRPERGSARAWLLTIARDQARRTSSRRRTTYVLDAATDTAYRAGVDTDRDLDMRRALRRLSGRQREAVVLFYYLDISVDDVAAVMGCSAGTVKSTLSDSRTRLAQILGSHYE